MLYSLTKSEMERLRQIDIPFFEYPGAEMLSALFRTDPDIVQTILPKPLVPADEPLGWVFVARYPETNFGLTSYNEGALFVKAMYKGEPGWYCLALPVDNDMAMIPGREIGFPKKMAEKITLERTDNHVKGCVIRRGVEILHVEAELTDPVSATHLNAVGPEVNDLEGNPCRKFVAFSFKSSFSPTGGLDYLPKLVRNILLLRPRDEIRSGVGKLEMVSSPYDPLGDIPVRDLLDVSYGTFDNQQFPGRVVARVKNPLGFMRYAGFKMDYLGWMLEQEDIPTRPERSERKRRQKAIKQY